MPAKKSVIAKMKDFLNKHDNVKVEVEELELTMSAEASEVNLRYILCKEYISNYRKLATKTVYLQHEQQHER